MYLGMGIMINHITFHDSMVHQFFFLVSFFVLFLFLFCICFVFVLRVFFLFGFLFVFCFFVCLFVFFKERHH